MMDETLNKVEGILRDIGLQPSQAEPVKEQKKSMDEVVNIMLGHQDSVQTAENSRKDVVCPAPQGVYHFDMQELEKWRVKNNETYEIHSWLPIHSHRKILGRFIIFGKKVARKCLKWYIDPIVEQQNLFNGNVTASVNSLYNNEVVTESFIQDMEGLHQKATELNLWMEDLQNAQDKLSQSVSVLQEAPQEAPQEDGRIQAVCGEVEALKGEISRLSSDVERRLYELSNSMERGFSELSSAMETCRTKEQDLYDLTQRKEQELLQKLGQEKENVLQTIREKQESVLRTIREEKESLLTLVNQKSEALSRECADNKNAIQNINTKLDVELDYLEFKLYQETKKNKGVGSKGRTTTDKEPQAAPAHIQQEAQEEDKDLYGKIDYFKFENHFRGSRESIKKNQEFYLKYFKDKKNVLDLGCGRGEFLELLKEQGIPYQGVDLYGEYVEYCNYKGLDAVEGDAVEFVCHLPDNSIGGCFAAQIAEHLPTEQLIKLCTDVYKKLEKGGCFILETPNPTCLSIYTNAFYVDPSHEKPVHPKTLEYFLREAGFREIEIIFTEESKSGYRLPLLNGSQITNLAEFNDGMNFLSNILFGSQDYAIVATK